MGRTGGVESAIPYVAEQLNVAERLLLAPMNSSPCLSQARKECELLRNCPLTPCIVIPDEIEMNGRLGILEKGVMV
jgi:hypothetical protein